MRDCMLPSFLILFGHNLCHTHMTRNAVFSYLHVVQVQSKHPVVHYLWLQPWTLPLLPWTTVGSSCRLRYFFFLLIANKNVSDAIMDATSICRSWKSGMLIGALISHGNNMLRFFCLFPLRNSAQRWIGDTLMKNSSKLYLGKIFPRLPAF